MINQNGMSLVSVLVSIAIVSVLVMTLTSMMSLSNKTRILHETSSSVELDVYNLKNILKNGTSCTSSLFNNVASPPNFAVANANIKIYDPTDIIPPPKVLFETGKKFKGYEIKELKVISVLSDPVIPTNKTIRVRIIFDYYEGNEKTAEFVLLVVTNGANRIQSCLTDDAYVRGGYYGSCFLTWNAAFNIIASGNMAWPVTSCPNAGNSNPTCAAGFSLTALSFVQGNTGATGGFNDNLDIYWVSYACVKN